jgi:cytochrome P450
MSAVLNSDGIATPAGAGGVLAWLIAEQPAPAVAARLGAWLARLWSRPLRVGPIVLVVRHAQVVEAFMRDLDFRIAPINAARIEQVNGPFVLGMDRGVTLVHERQAIYAALAGVDLAAIQADLAARAQVQAAAAGNEIDAIGGYARPLAAGTARALFGIAGSDEQTFMDVARSMFNHVFLNQSGDKDVEARAVRAAVLLREWLSTEIARRRAANDLGSDVMGMLLRGGALDDDGVRRNVGGMLVGSIDTTASCVAKIVAMIGRDPALGRRVAADVDDPERLAGWCREALRRWPHNPLVMRQAQADTVLAGTQVRAGDKMILWTQAAMLDATTFPRPGTARADRPQGAYLHYGAGLHPCGGRAVNAFQIPLLVGALVRRGIASVGKVDWAGPFPAHMTVRFGR